MIRTFVVGVVAVALVVAASGCDGGSQTNSSARRLTDLRSVGQLQRAFNKATGEPRLVVIVSPT